MSNWIFNQLTISGPAEEIKRFKDGLLKVGDEICLLQSYVSGPLGYRWCCENWSTKWEPWDVELNEVSPTKLVFKFISAYNPPLKAFKQIVTFFPGLDFHLVFFEGLGDFKGFSHWFNGEWVDGEWVIGGVFEDNSKEEELGDEFTTIEDLMGGVSVLGEAEPVTVDVKEMCEL